MNVSVTTGAATGGFAKVDLVWDNQTRTWMARDTYQVHYEMTAATKILSIQPQMPYLSLLTPADQSNRFRTGMNLSVGDSPSSC